MTAMTAQFLVSIGIREFGEHKDMGFNSASDGRETNAADVMAGSNLGYDFDRTASYCPHQSREAAPVAASALSRHNANTFNVNTFNVNTPDDAAEAEQLCRQSRAERDRRIWMSPGVPSDEVRSQ
jgi:biotin synthase-related radical SAM superfamily protein